MIKYTVLPIVVLCSACVAGHTNVRVADQRIIPSATQAVQAPSKPVFYGSSQGDIPFSEAVKVGNTLYLSGQIGIVDGKLATGGTAAETKQTLKNIFVTLQRYGYQPRDIVKCTAMLKDMRDFDAFNREYRAMFSPSYPARSAFGVSDLAMDANVEIECIAAR